VPDGRVRGRQGRRHHGQLPRHRPGAGAVAGRRRGVGRRQLQAQQQLAADTVAAIEAAGGRGIAVQADVEDPEQIEALFARAGEAFGHIDYFVSNAAAAAFKPIADLKVHHLDRTFAMNERAFVLGVQQAAPLMTDGGRIVVLTSYGSLRAYPTYAALGAAKAAAEAWVRYMALELAPLGINVNAVNGGLIDSDSLHFFYGVEGMAPIETVLEKIPKRRPGTVKEVADCVRFLLDPASEYVTGQTLIVDGGLSIVAPPFHADVSGPLELPTR